MIYSGAEELLKRLTLRASAVEYARSLGFEPDPWQKGILETGARDVVVNCSRQVGKSTVVAIKTAHEAQYNDNALILITSPTERQSQELLIKVKRTLSEAGARMKRESMTMLELENGTRVFALPGNEDTIRGFSGPRLLIIDEAAMVEDSLYYSVEPMLAVSQGQTIILSTPRGKRGFFYQKWHSEGWEHYSVNAVECPRIPEEWLEAKKTTMPEYWFRQEYMCEFLDAEDAAFNTELLLAARRDFDTLYTGEESKAGDYEPLEV